MWKRNEFMFVTRLNALILFTFVLKTLLLNILCVTVSLFVC